MVDIGRERRSTRKLQPGWTVGGSTNDADSDFCAKPNNNTSFYIYNLLSKKWVVMNMCKPGGLSCCLCSALAPWQLTHCFWCFLSYFRFNMQVTRGALGQFFRQLSKWSIQQLLSNHLFSEFVWKCRTAWDGPVSLPNFKIHRYQKKFKRIQKNSKDSFWVFQVGFQKQICKKPCPISAPPDLHHLRTAGCMLQSVLKYGHHYGDVVVMLLYVIIQLDYKDELYKY